MTDCQFFEGSEYGRTPFFNTLDVEIETKNLVLFTEAHPINIHLTRDNKDCPLSPIPFYGNDISFGW